MALTHEADIPLDTEGKALDIINNDPILKSLRSRSLADVEAYVNQADNAELKEIVKSLTVYTWVTMRLFKELSQKGVL